MDPAKPESYGMTVKEMVMNIDAKLDRFIEKHDKQHDELAAKLTEQALSHQRAELQAAVIPSMQKDIEELQDFRSEALGAGKVMRVLFGTSVVGAAVSLLSLWMTLHGGKL